MAWPSSLIRQKTIRNARATQTLFGQVTGLCPRHGFRSPELEDADSHTKKGAQPAAKTVDHPLLRPPDLIIQDELHLISGPLGTLVGLYETAVDELASWEVDGKRVRPKVIASTATIRRAADQVHQVFLRKVAVFPSQGLDVEDNFFALRRPVDGEFPGRRYLGICAPGKRVKAANIRVYVALLAAAERLYKKYGAAADPWMTLAGYFASLRELGGMRRLVDDDIRSRLRDTDMRGLATRGPLIVEELTSRKGADDIPRVLTLLEARFDPILEAARVATAKTGQALATQRPLDVLLATNMISVGVDVKRLGLMVVAGQPKTTSEYIQATSRVGRSQPGLVVIVYNWARPRDLSHYESFHQYHATFYQHVEALSVTPFAARALDRGLSAVLVSLARLAAADLNGNLSAESVTRSHPLIVRAMTAIETRARQVSGSKTVAANVSALLKRRVDLWVAQAQRKTAGRRLGYQARDEVTVGLLQQAGKQAWGDFTCLGSLRDVEPTIPLILDPLDVRGLDDDAPVPGADA